MKLLHKGKYYWHRDDSIKGMHPSYIYKKNDKKNKYNIICFTTSPGKGRRKLNNNIDPNNINDDCYVHLKPRISKRKSFGSELVGYKITNKKDKGLVKYIKNKKK